MSELQWERQGSSSQVDGRMGVFYAEGKVCAEAREQQHTGAQRCRAARLGREREV